MLLLLEQIEISEFVSALEPPCVEMALVVNSYHITKTKMQANKKAATYIMQWTCGSSCCNFIST